jgi:HTH-type transcriptional regulator/antitoxin HigA
MAGEVKPIRTKHDHDAALKEVERLWGAKAGTREGDRLDVLAALIDAYEAERYPMDPPGLSIAMIRRLHERLGISAEVLIRPSRKRAA